MYGQEAAPLIQNAFHRPGVTLDGQWKYIVDPYETGYRNHRNWKPFDSFNNTKASAKPYWNNRATQHRSDRQEYDFDHAPTLEVPGDWNHQREELLYYEGTVWYQRDFQYEASRGKKVFLYIGAANYRADIYMNGKKVGFHEGGFNPFNFDVTNYLKPGSNWIIIRVDNRRDANRVPGLTFDWWNYGGLTRSVKLIELPTTFIQDYFIQLDPQQPDQVKGYLQLNQPAQMQVTLRIPEINFQTNVETNASGRAELTFSAQDLLRWYPERPKLYDILLSAGADHIRDRIGFRTIEVKGQDILLNGKKVFLRGICLHEENPFIAGRPNSQAEAKMLFGWAKELNANFVRLAHYPHHENMPRVADEMGLLLWEEVPVYWGINYTNPDSYNQAASQIRALVHRDKNRAGVIIWSVANETPREDPERLRFLQQMKAEVEQLDRTRLVSAALDRTEDKAAYSVTITDPFALESDIVAANEYIGWYGSTPERIPKMKWDLSPHSKPFFISEFGAGAKYNLRGDSLTRWTEDYQDWMFRETLQMLDKVPSFRGVTPWILVDFRSPRRNLPLVQDQWNRKGLISDKGQKKLAFFTLKAYYDQKAKEYQYPIDD